ncbi:phosphotransferase enzyme family protein [Paenibacillus aceris]|uniref:Homoserine kinase type II n=1 Tax=Paenibacillus aceris TaxID=869555 RepID=A0ABS4IAB4_9BACL|nr:phosphotransferase [Paenibacillus aceris]MBP1967864.1 homoserine kinase type II [Paenibacillus aceris]NHW39051.1 phosphotransferase [Paenibacillus aceris]
MVESNQVLEEIVSDIEANFGIKVTNAHLLHKGWLNVKWRLTTVGGFIFVKFYHPDRYKLHLTEKRKKIEMTLYVQQQLFKSGLSCPEVYDLDGRFIQETRKGHRYAVMGWVEGSVPETGSISLCHMYDLGQTTGRMHQLLRDIPLARPAWEPDQKACLKALQANLEQARNARNLPLIDLLDKAIMNVQWLDFDVFAESPIGWLHWDLWADNLLLHENGAVTIVDFDRMDVAYPEIDIARAVLSGAWESERFRLDAADSFLKGYREHAALPEGTFLRAVQMLYLIESIWWLRTEIHEDSGVPARFFRELEWLTQQWERLPEIFCHI